jgi:hydrogenase expression/formation protein HypD
MEVCGGHTHTICRYGIEHLLPPGVELVHGPGCPVCVIPLGRVNDAIAVAETHGVVFTSFGDMMRTRRPRQPPRSHGTGRRHALRLLAAVGFETTAPSTALTLLRAPCTPEIPIGTCMVSSEGTCAANYNFGRLHRTAAVSLH